ncbi:MAG: cation:proton antiporter [Rhodobacterales bacterium]|nr:cation:proton antiporter [Rhodobacterales bacterium]
MSGAVFLSWSVDITFILLMVAMILALIRLAKGPTLADRVVGLDMMTVLIVVFCAVFAIFADDSTVLDVALVVALIGFLATVALARFTERRQKRRNREDQT